MSMRQIEKLKRVQAEHRERLRQIVGDALKEEKILSESLNADGKVPLTFGERMADKIALFGGSWKFIFLFFFVVALWISLNVFALTVKFDPFPFILMNLFLSCVAALQAPFIMMSQNRKEERDRTRAENDYMVNLKAELEIRSLHQKIDLLLNESMKTLYDSQANQLALLKEIDLKIGIKRVPPEEKKTDVEL